MVNVSKMLLVETQKLEKELGELLRSKRNGLGKDRKYLELREKIFENYTNIFCSDPKYAMSKDLDQYLWKFTFYKAIDNYRGYIKKIRQQTKSKHAGSAKNEKLHNVRNEFLEFLKGSKNCYLRLLEKREALYKVEKRVAEKDAIKNGIFKTFIILGDLERYSDVYNRENVNMSRLYANAREYYKKANELIPDSGNPHNQMAVVATYADQEVEAIYYYFRSLAVRVPFSSATENLKYLFEKNRQQYQVKAYNADVSRFKSHRPKHVKNFSALDLFLLRFVRIHGIIFTKISLELLPDILSTCVEEFKSLLEEEEITEDLMLKMTVMNIYQLHNIQKTVENENQRSGLLSNMLDVSFQLVKLILEASTNSGKFSFLDSISVFLMYLQKHPDLFQLDVKSQQVMFDALGTFLNESQSISLSKDTGASLPEDILLRGFSPLESIPHTHHEESPQAIFSSRLIRIRNVADALVSFENIPFSYATDSSTLSEQPLGDYQTPLDQTENTSSYSFFLSDKFQTDTQLQETGQAQLYLDHQNLNTWNEGSSQKPSTTWKSPFQQYQGDIQWSFAPTGGENLWRCFKDGTDGNWETTINDPHKFNEKPDS